MDPNFNSRSSDSCHWSSHHRRHEEKMVPWKDNGIDKGTHIFTYQRVCLYFRVLTIAEMKEWNSNLRPKSMFDYPILAFNKYLYKFILAVVESC